MQQSLIIIERKQVTLKTTDRVTYAIKTAIGLWGIIIDNKLVSGWCATEDQAISEAEEAR